MTPIACLPKPHGPVMGAPPAPVINSVTLDNTSPTVGDTITATVSATGADSLAYQWLADGSPISGQTASTYTTDRDNAMGHAITCQVIGTNGAGDSTPGTSDPTAQVTGVPVFDVAPAASPSSVSWSNGDVANCDGGTVSGFPAPSTAYQWNDAANTPSQAYNANPADQGNNVHCTVTVTNGIGDPVNGVSNEVSVTP